ncbi:MAG TPA: Fic family protein [Syntrophales bacterium]|nr:MAG: cell filamentation protein Fic [Deltaproteobacteria bacterium GWA2_54_12]HLE17863.1 Fic family protein [Syntrophales bacterium]
MKPTFKHYDLALVAPDFNSPLTGLIIELDHLRRKQLSGSTPTQIFFQLKHIFHTLESIGSARIEGNNTTIAEYIETKLSETQSPSNKGILEIVNMEQAMSFIDENIKDMALNRALLSELHKKVVAGLIAPPDGEGDHTPGIYRAHNVKIIGATHKPPESIQIHAYMDELFSFINHADEPRYDLLKVAIAHHRFLWIHPFTNGNGRTVRLFTYAMLVKQGFNVDVGRILNPTAVFCSDRKKYYNYLSSADSGQREGILSWCEYVLKGLKDEIEKIDRLLDYDYLKKEILLPAISFSLERRYVNDIEGRIMKRVVEKKVLQASDLKDIFPGKYASDISRNISRLKEKRMLVPIRDGARKYIIRFDNNFLLRGIIKLLGEKGFIAIND